MSFLLVEDKAVSDGTSTRQHQKASPTSRSSSLHGSKLTSSRERPRSHNTSVEKRLASRGDRKPRILKRSNSRAETRQRETSSGHGSSRSARSGTTESDRNTSVRRVRTFRPTTPELINKNERTNHGNNIKRTTERLESFDDLEDIDLDIGVEVEDIPAEKTEETQVIVSILVELLPPSGITNS